MPLQSGSGRAAFEHNVRTEVAAGKPQRQALAIAYSKRGEDAWQPKPLPKGVFNWKVTYAVHGDESRTNTRVVKAKTEKDAFDEFFRYARGHDRPIKIEKMRDSLSAIALDGLAERIAGARALYNRPGTPGEKEAAAAALRRMGIDPNTMGSSASPESQRSPPPGPRQKTGGARRYRVILQYVWTNKMGVTKTMETSPFVTEATDQIHAESLARADAMYTWRKTVGGRPPEFRAYSTTRVGDVTFERQERTMRKYSGGDSLSAIAGVRNRDAPSLEPYQMSISQLKEELSNTKTTGRNFNRARYQQVKFALREKTAMGHDSLSAIARDALVARDAEYSVVCNMKDPAAFTTVQWVSKRVKVQAASNEQAAEKAVEFYKKRGYKNITPIPMKVSDVTSFEGQEALLRKYSGGDSLSAIARDALSTVARDADPEIERFLEKAKGASSAIQKKLIIGDLRRYLTKKFGLQEGMKKYGEITNSTVFNWLSSGDSLADLVEQARGGIRGQTGDDSFSEATPENLRSLLTLAKVMVNEFKNPKTNGDRRSYELAKKNLARIEEELSKRGQTRDAWNNVKTDGRYRLLEGTGPNGGDWRVVGPRGYDATFRNRAEAEKQMLREADRRP